MSLVGPTITQLVCLALKICEQSQKLGSIREPSLGCMYGKVICMKQLHFISWNRRKENSTVSCGSSPIKIHYVDYPKRFICRINDQNLMSFQAAIAIFY